jgi:hypothetical protein
MRTAGIKRLVEEVLDNLPKPHTEDIIDEVFHAIEHQPAWRRQYDALSADLGKTVVNTWGAFWIANSEGRAGTNQVPAGKSTLIDSYSKLTQASKKAGKKLKQPEALKIMSEYYQANRQDLPSSIVNHRDIIVQLLMAGYTAEEAFAKVQPGAV